MADEGRNDVLGEQCQDGDSTENSFAWTVTANGNIGWAESVSLVTRFTPETIQAALDAVRKLFGRSMSEKELKDAVRKTAIEMTVEWNNEHEMEGKE